MPLLCIRFSLIIVNFRPGEYEKIWIFARIILLAKSARPRERGGALFVPLNDIVSRPYLYFLFGKKIWEGGVGDGDGRRARSASGSRRIDSENNF